MKIHYLQHVPFENLANLQPWLLQKQTDISCTKFFENEPLPKQQNFDLLIVLGGPMNIYEENTHFWLKNEKSFIEETISKGKHVLGICLGAQLIADVLGSKVYKNNHPEIGWYTIHKTAEANNSSMKEIPLSSIAFHWHGDTFDIPYNATHLASSKYCRNQAFIYDNKVLGLQFHLESSIYSVKKMIINCGDELINRNYIQKEEEILHNLEYNITASNKTMNIILETFLKDLIKK